MPLTVELPQSPPGRETRASSRARREAAEQAQTPLRAAATAEEAGSTTPFLSPTAHVARHQRMYFVFISCM